MGGLAIDDGRAAAAEGVVNAGAGVAVDWVFFVAAQQI